MDSTPRATDAHLALSPAERAAIGAELAKLRARVANLASRLDRLHAALAATDEHARRTQVVAAPINRVPGPVTAVEAGPWR